MPHKTYQNDELQVLITYLPEGLVFDSSSGTKEEGELKFHSEAIVDANFGPYIRFEYSWTSAEFDSIMTEGDLINEIDRQYQRLRMPISERGGEYINSHFNQWLIGGRIMEEKKIQYPLVEINGVVYCEHSERLIHYNFVIFRDIFAQWKPALLQLLKSVKFHY